MYYGKNIPAALHGKHGYLQQLRAYALVHKDTPKHLADCVQRIDNAIDAIESQSAREVIINVYRNGRTLRETQFDLGHSLAWVTAHHALGVSDFGYRVDWEFGRIALTFDKRMGRMIAHRPPVESFAPLPIADAEPLTLATPEACVSTLRQMAAEMGGKVDDR